jgi:hypothetical protein
MGANKPAGFLSINISDLGEVQQACIKSRYDMQNYFEGVLKTKEKTLLSGGGKKRSSRTRTIRKTKKRNFRGRRRTNRRHRRNVKK